MPNLNKELNMLNESMRPQTADNDDNFDSLNWNKEKKEIGYGFNDSDDSYYQRVSSNFYLYS